MRKYSLASAVVGIVLLFAGLRGQQPVPPEGYAPGELLIKFSPALNPGQRTAMLAGRGASRLRRFAALDIDHVRLPAGLAMTAVLAAFRAMPGVLAVQPNYIRHVVQTAPPNDPFWLDGSLWGLLQIHAPEAWSSFTSGDGSVVIADIDTGVAYGHSDLAPNMWHNPLEIPANGIDDDGNGYVDDVYGIDTFNHDSNPLDDQGHGTHTSGTLAGVGNNGTGVVGVNWNAKVLACKFIGANGTGTDSGAIECFDYIVALKNRGVNIRVSSNSWGGARGNDPPAAALQAAIDAAGNAGIVNVFAAGNDGMNNDAAPFDPASYSSPSIVAVASSGYSDERSHFSNYGAVSVHLAAPGEDILSTWPGNSYNYASGTSMATPHVAGVAALLAAMDPTLTVAGIKALLLENVDHLAQWQGVVSSGGRLNAFKAASSVGLPPNTPPSVTITGPVDGATFLAPATLSIDATATDSDGTVQQVTFYANGSPLATDMTSPYSVTWSNVGPGGYTLTAVATDDRGASTTSAPVHVTVPANVPPSVALVGPAEGSSLTSPATFTLEASATDSDGTVQQVAFFANGAAIGSDATAPYGLTWNAPAGTWTLTAVATDNAGATTTSAAVHVTVNPLPGRTNVALAASGGFAIASSTYNPNYPAAGTINGDRKGLQWGAGGGWNDGTPNAGPDWIEVDFAGPKLIEEVNVFSMQDSYNAPAEPTPAMTFTYWGIRVFEVQYWDGTAWTDVPGGAIANNNLVWRQVVFAPLTTSKIRIYITGALNGYSRVMEVEAWGVAGCCNALPAVAISAPADGASYVAPATLTVAATASDADGSVKQVAFYANGTPIGTDTSSPFSVAWNNVAAGSYTLTAVATDNANATTTSAPVHVTVAVNTPPTVAIVNPADGSTLTAPVTIPINAAAGDSDGTVQQVAFYANGSLLATDAAAPYSYSWINVPVGSYTLTAVATDNNGATTTSSAVHVTVAPAPGRMNWALAGNGGLALASSTYSGNYPASGAINGDRKGLKWGAGGGWNDGTPNTSPDWIEVDFNGLKTIDEVNVFSMQDNYNAPVEPSPSMTFTYWGLRAFEVQYWNGASWVAVPGSAVTNNNLVWRQVLFAAVTTSKIRINITSALNGYSRVIEVEAWGVAAGSQPN